jgi:hypothetical protein
MGRPSVVDVHLDDGGRPVVTGGCGLAVEGRLTAP